MIIADLNYDERIEKLKRDIKYVKSIKNALSQSRSEFRRFSQNIDLSFKALMHCFDSYERTVLIDAYTLSEQLIKNSYYYLLEKDLSSQYLKQFLNSKLPREKFSPNVKYSEIIKNMKSDLKPNFSFLIGEENDNVKSYNELINERHRYAHTGNYLFQFERIDEAVVTIEYLYKEFELIINRDDDYISNFRNSIRDVFKEFKRANSIISNFDKNSQESVKVCYESLISLQSKINDSFKQYPEEYSLSIFSNYKEVSNSFLAIAINKEDIEQQMKAFKDIEHSFTELKISKS